MATRAPEVAIAAPALSAGAAGHLAETHACATFEWYGSGTGGSAFHSQISWRAILPRRGSVGVRAFGWAGGT